MGAEEATRCVLYLRVSLDATGEGLAIERQREECRRIAEVRGWTVLREYVDNSRSATSTKKARPAYDEMTADYQAGAFDALVCWDLDRLTRQPRQLEDWVDAAEVTGLLLVTANGEADLSTDGGRMYARIKIAVARAEIERKSARRRSANAQRAQSGYNMKGARLTGYTPNMAIVEAEATAVREVFDRFASGDSLRALAKRLTESGVPTRFGRSWSPTSVRQILTNPRYAGRVVYQGNLVPVEGQWTPLVAAEVFDHVQERVNDPRRRKQQGTDRKHLGSGLYLCAVCGNVLQAWSGHRYACRAAIGNGGGHANRSRGPVDDYVTTVLRERLARADLADLLPAVEDEAGQRAAEKIRLLRARLATVEGDYDAGLIDGRRYNVASEKIMAELGAAELESARAGAKHVLHLVRAPDPVTAFETASLMIKRGIVDALCLVRLRAGRRGSRRFDPDSVVIDWK